MDSLLPITVKEIAVNLNIAEQKVFEKIDSIAQRKLSELQCNREQLITNALASRQLFGSRTAMCLVWSVEYSGGHPRLWGR